MGEVCTGLAQRLTLAPNLNPSSSPGHFDINKTPSQKVAARSVRTYAFKPEGQSTKHLIYAQRPARTDKVMRIDGVSWKKRLPPVLVYNHNHESDMPSTYDQVLYPSLAFSETHPDNLAAIATLHGLTPPTGPCRVLEVGCGDASNLIPMALVDPLSHFVGFDLATRPIQVGQAVIQSLGLSNIELFTLDILEFPPSLGTFDYIIAHGFCAWVPAFVLEKFFAVCQAHLSPHGVIFASYNTYPQAHAREASRQIMHAQPPGPEASRVTDGKHFLSTIRRFVTDPLWQATLDSEIKRLDARPDSVTFHDELGGAYNCFYVADFVALAARHGFQYLAEGLLRPALRPNVPPEALAELRVLSRGDEVTFQQYLDFVTYRGFRRTLLCRSNLPIQRDAINDNLLKLRVASPLYCVSQNPSGSETFRNGGGPGQMESNNPFLSAVLHRLETVWPRSLPLAELLPDPSAIAETPTFDQLISLAVNNLLFLRHTDPPVASQTKTNPTANPLARLQAASGTLFTTMLHTQVRFDDDFSPKLIALLDGTRPASALAPLLNGTTPTLIATALQSFYRVGLMIA